MMTFKKFREMTSGVSHYQLFFRGKWIVGKEIFEYDDYIITEFDFVSDDSGTITCTIDIEEVDQKQSIFFIFENEEGDVQELPSVGGKWINFTKIQ